MVNLPRIKHKKWIEESNKVFSSYDFRITLRQLFYVLVHKGFIEKDEKRYRSLSSHLTKGRKEGSVSWEVIIDTTRENIDKRMDYITIREQIDSVISYVNYPYKLPKEYGQKKLNIFFVEKDSLRPFIEPYLYSNSILVIGKGQNSWSNMYELSKILFKNSMDIHAYTLVDYDLSGIYIHNTFKDQLDHFNIEYVEFDNIAITEKQIEEYGLPRHKNEIQLQALDPKILRDLIIQTCNKNWDYEIDKKRKQLQNTKNIIYQKKLRQSIKNNFKF